MKKLCVLLVAMLFLLTVQGACAATIREREATIGDAIGMIEAYLLRSPVDLPLLSETLQGIGGNGRLLASYVDILAALEEDNVNLGVILAAQWCENDNFRKMLDEIGSDIIGTADDLLNYVRGRAAEQSGDLALADHYYMDCYAFFDSAERHGEYEDNEKGRAYDLAAGYIQQGAWLEAYLYVVQLANYDFRDSVAMRTWILENHPEVAVQLAQQGMDLDRPETIPAEYRLFAPAATPTPLPTPTPVPTPSPEPTVNYYAGSAWRVYYSGPEGSLALYKYSPSEYVFELKLPDGAVYEGDGTEEALRIDLYADGEDRIGYVQLVESACAVTLNGGVDTRVIPSAAFPEFTLQKGSRGAVVRGFQHRLISLQYLNDAADGVFGGKTEAAVKRFQQDNGLNATGIIDEAAARKLFPKAY